MGGAEIDDEFRDSYNIRYDTEKGQLQSSILGGGHGQEVSNYLYISPFYLTSLSILFVFIPT